MSDHLNTGCLPSVAKLERAGEFLPGPVEEDHSLADPAVAPFAPVDCGNSGRRMGFPLEAERAVSEKRPPETRPVYPEGLGKRPGLDEARRGRKR